MNVFATPVTVMERKGKTAGPRTSLIYPAVKNVILPAGRKSVIMVMNQHPGMAFILESRHAPSMKELWSMWEMPWTLILSHA